MKTIETETGTATLYDDDVMVVDNGGYTQHLTPEQVKAAWQGDTLLPLTPLSIREMQEGGLEIDEMLTKCPRLDGQYYDFGDEMHVIPSKREFDNT